MSKITGSAGSELWAAQVNADETGALLAEAEQHLQEMVELLENEDAVRLLRLYLMAKRHLDHARKCEPCAETTRRYAQIRAGVRKP